MALTRNPNGKVQPKTFLLTCLLLTLFTGAIYGRVLVSDFVYDDYIYILDNDQVKEGLTFHGMRWALTATRDCNWFPLTWMSHMLDVSLFDLNSHAHHGVSLLFHLLNTLLLMLTLTRITGFFWRSAVVAALFALHPLHVESVAWVAERKDLLSGFFFMLVLLAYHAYATRPGITRYFLLLLAFALGLSAKPMLVTVPFLLLLLDYWPLRRTPFLAGGTEATAAPFMHLLAEKIPLMALSAISSAITFQVQKTGGAMVDFANSSPIANSANAVRGYITYIYRTFLPLDLAVFYPFPRHLPLWESIAFGFLLAATTVWLILIHNRSPYLLTGWFWFLGTLVPVIGFVRVGEQAMADRYTYLPLIGLFIMVTWGAAELTAGKPGRRLLPVVAIAGISFLALLTWVQTGYWRDSITLFNHAIDVTEENWVAYNNMGAALVKRGEIREALPYVNEALRIAPGNPSVYMNLGIIATNLRDIDGAIGYFRKNLELQPENEEGHFSLGRSLLRKGDMAGAWREYYYLLRHNPKKAEFFLRLMNQEAAMRR